MKTLLIILGILLAIVLLGIIIFGLIEIIFVLLAGKMIFENFKKIREDDQMETTKEIKQIINKETYDYFKSANSVDLM